MKEGLTSRRRGPLLGVLALTLSVGVLAVGASQGLARARADGSASVPVFRHANPEACPPSGDTVVGRVQFELKSSTLTVKIKLRGADPGQYFVLLRDGDSCSITGGPFGKFKVDASGDGSYAFSTTVSGGRSFNIDALNDTTGQSNVSATANL